MNKYSLYIPNLDKEVERHVMEEIARRLGGVSVADCEGLWVSSAGNIVKDNNRIIYSYCDEDVTAFFRDLAAYVKDKLKQESVLLTVEEVPRVLFI